MTRKRPPASRQLLRRVVREATYRIEDMARGAGITTAALRRYRAGSRRVSVDLLRERLPDAFRAHGRMLIALAAELETTPIKED